MHLKINKPRVKSRQTLLNNQFLTVYQDQLVLGHQTHDYFWTKVANGVSVVALNDSRQICLITVYRHASNTFALSLPSGGIDISETPLAAAKRELAEEAGVYSRSVNERVSQRQPLRNWVFSTHLPARSAKNATIIWLPV